MRLFALSAILLSAGTANANVQLGCIFEGLPPILITYTAAPDTKAVMEVDGRPAATMTLGQGSERLESADVDGYHFEFSPSNMTMQVERDGNVLHKGAGRCVTIGGPSNVKPLELGYEAPNEPTEEAPAEPTVPTGKWTVEEDKSAFDDTQTVILFLDADQEIPGQYGGSTTPSLILRCMEDRTSVYLTMGDYFLSDIQGYGNVDYRIDDTKAQVARMSSSTDNHALGLWSGGASIPFIKQLATGEKLALRITPYNESPRELSFSLTGLNAVLPKLREACSW